MDYRFCSKSGRVSRQHLGTCIFSLQQTPQTLCISSSIVLFNDSVSCVLTCYSLNQMMDPLDDLVFQPRLEKLKQDASHCCSGYSTTSILEVREDTSLGKFCR